MREKTAIYWVILLNIIDAGITVCLLRTGYVEEANPIMREALRVHEFFFLAAKSAIVAASIYLFWLIGKTHPRMAKLGLNIAVGLYVIVVVYSAIMFGYGQWLQATYARGGT